MPEAGRDSEWFEGWLLHSRPYRDTSLIVEVFTRQAGRQAAVIRGVRSQARRRSSTAPQLFTPFRCQLRGRGELQTVSRWEQGQMLPLAGRKLYCALYCNELIIRLLHHHEVNEDIFRLYEAALQQLPGYPEEWVLRCFELGLLALTGYSLGQLPDESPEATKRYVIHPEQGVLAEKAAAGHSEEGCIVSAELLALVTLIQSRFQALPELLEQLMRELPKADLPVYQKELKKLSRVLLKPHLGNRPLESRKLFMALPARQPVVPENQS